MLIYITNIVGRSQPAINLLSSDKHLLSKKEHKERPLHIQQIRQYVVPQMCRRADGTWTKLFSPDRSRGWAKTPSLFQQCDSKPFKSAVTVLVMEEQHSAFTGSRAINGDDKWIINMFTVPTTIALQEDPEPPLVRMMSIKSSPEHYSHEKNNKKKGESLPKIGN